MEDRRTVPRRLGFDYNFAAWRERPTFGVIRHSLSFKLIPYRPKKPWIEYS
jgi:hypothetical protein